MRLTEEQFAFLLGKKAPQKKSSKQVITGYKSNVKGWRTIGTKKCYFRSLWEIQYAQYLEWLRHHQSIFDWEYEPKLFEFPKDKYRTGPFYYKPDFRVLELDKTHTWYEVKGYMNQDSKKKLKRFNKHFPNERLIIISKAWFTQARKKNLHSIIGWEKLPPK